MSLKSPTHSGGLTTTKFVVEWDPVYDFPSSNMHVLSLSHPSCCDADADGSCTTSHVCRLSDQGGISQVKITGLVEGTPYYVRVGAYSSAGYGDMALSSPESLDPQPQIPPVPTTVTIEVSQSDIPGHIHLEYTVPTYNALMYPTPDGGDAIKAYLVEWDTKFDFTSGAGNSPMASYVAPTVDSFGSRNVCDSGACVLQLGAEVQKVTVYAGVGTITGGSYSLSLGGTYGSTSCIAHDAAASAVVSALEGLSGVNAGEFEVSREAITSPGVGIEYQITFSGPNVQGDLPSLTIDDAAGCTAFTGSVDLLDAQVVTEAVADGNVLTPGQSYYVRVSAVNDVGTSDPTGSSPAVLAPRSPPNPPENVEVVSVRDDATALRVTWEAPSATNGAAILNYRVEISSDDFASIDASDTTDAATLQSTVTGLTPGQVYRVRVVAINDQESLQATARAPRRLL